MNPSPPPGVWYRPSTWQWEHLPDLPWWLPGLVMLVGAGIAWLLPRDPRPQRLDVVTYQAAQARQEALLQEIRAELRQIREVLEQRR